LSRARRFLSVRGTRGGNEVDFVVYGQDVLWAIEVKHSGAVRSAARRP